MLKIERISARTVSVPLARPVVSSIHDINRIGCVLITVETNQNVTGEGLLFTLNDEFVFLMRDAVARMGEGLVGLDADDPEAAWNRMWRRIQFFGWSGFLMFAVSGIDMALWDARARHRKVSIRDLVGGTGTTVPAYASDCLFLNRSEDELVAEARQLCAEGFGAMKIRVGSGSVENDARRVALVRDAIGDDIRLMADANQALDLTQSIALGKRLSDHGLTWFEEPMPPYDFDAYAKLRAAVDVPIATGESNYTMLDFEALADRGAADVLMPDYSRVGGLTQMLNVARLAEARGLAFSPHLYPEHSLSAVASTTSGTFIEMMPWFAPLFGEQLALDKGIAAVPDRHGFGFSFDPAAVARYAIDPPQAA